MKRTLIWTVQCTHQAGQVRNKERNTGEHREQQADIEQQGWETPWPWQPHKPAIPAGLGEGLARALEVWGPGRRSRGPRLAERGGLAVKAPPGQTPAVRVCAACERRWKWRARSRHRGRQSAGRATACAQGVGEQEVAGSSGQPAIASANRLIIWLCPFFDHSLITFSIHSLIHSLIQITDSMEIIFELFDFCLTLFDFCLIHYLVTFLAIVWSINWWLFQYYFFYFLHT